MKSGKARARRTVAGLFTIAGTVSIAGWSLYAQTAGPADNSAADFAP